MSLTSVYGNEDHILSFHIVNYTDIDFPVFVVKTLTLLVIYRNTGWHNIGNKKFWHLSFSNFMIYQFRNVDKNII